MTLKDMKIRVLALIEELNPDFIDTLDEDTDIEDIMLKMNSIIDQVQNEVSRYKKIPAKMEHEINEPILNIKNIPLFYQFNKIIGANYNVIDNDIIFNDDEVGKTVTIYYYKFPEPITKDNENDYDFELTQDAINIVPLGVAAVNLQNDRISNYGKVYRDEYIRLLQMLDPRQSIGSVQIDGGYDV